MSGALDHEPAEIVRQLLVDLSQGSDPPSVTQGQTVSWSAWPVFATGKPDEPDALISVFGSGSEKQGRDMTDGEVKERHTVAIIIRSASDNVGYIKASDVAQALDKNVRNTNVTVGSSTYLIHAASRRNGPNALGRGSESRGLVLFSLNYSFSIQQTV